MPTKPDRRKPSGVSAMLNVRYPADEVPALDRCATDRGMSRGFFIYLAVSREVKRLQRRRSRELSDGERRSA